MLHTSIPLANQAPPAGPEPTTHNIAAPAIPAPIPPGGHATPAAPSAPAHVAFAAHSTPVILIPPPLPLVATPMILLLPPAHPPLPAATSVVGGPLACCQPSSCSYLLPMALVPTLGPLPPLPMAPMVALSPCMPTATPAWSQPAAHLPLLLAWPRARPGPPPLVLDCLWGDPWLVQHALGPLQGTPLTCANPTWRGASNEGFEGARQ